MAVDEVSKVDFGRSRSTLTEDGCTELYTTNGRVLGRENVSLREVSDVPGLLPKYDDELREKSTMSLCECELACVPNVILRGVTGGVSKRDVLFDVVLEWWNDLLPSFTASDELCDALAILNFGGTSFSSSTSAREDIGKNSNEGCQQTKKRVRRKRILNRPKRLCYYKTMPRLDNIAEQMSYSVLSNSLIFSVPDPKIVVIRWEKISLRGPNSIWPYSHVRDSMRSQVRVIKSFSISAGPYQYQSVQ